MKIKKYLPIIGIGLFIYILLKLNISNIIHEIGNANILLIIFSFFLVFFSLMSQTLKWFAIAKKQDIKIPFKEAFKINLISNFYGFITPSRVGSIIRAEYLKKYTKNIGKGLCNFTLDKIFDFSSIFFIAIASSFIFREKLSFLPRELFIFLFFMLIILTFIFINKERSKRLLHIVYKRVIPKSKKEYVKLTFDSFYENIPEKKYFILFFILNVLNWIILYTIAFFIGVSLGMNAPYYSFLVILPIVTLISMIPITISGLGTREAAVISLFGVFGVSAAKAFSMSVLSLLITGIMPSLMAIYILFKKK